MKKSTGKRIAELIHPHDDGLRVCGQRLRDGRVGRVSTETYVITFFVQHCISYIK